MSTFTATLGVAFVGLLAKFFGLIAGIVSGIVMPLVIRILDTLLTDPNWIFSQDSPLIATITAAHTAALSLANGFLLLGLLFASAAIILRIGTGTYNIKKFLGSFVIMAILCNASQPIFYALLEVGNALLNSVSYLFAETGIGVTITDIKTYLQDLAGMNITAGGNVAGTILVLVAMLLSAWVLVKIALLLIERSITLFITLVIAPLSFGLSVLPTTQKMASQWFESVIKWLLAMPITYAILALGVFVLKQMGDNPSKFIYDLGDSINLVSGSTISAAPFHIAQAGVNIDVQKLFMFIIGMTLLYMSATVPKMLKIGGALTGMVESPQKLTGLAQKTGMQAYKTIADTASGKSFIGKNVGRLSRSGYNAFVGTKTGQAFEGWRQSQAGFLGQIVNRPGEQSRLAADRAREERQASISYQLGRVSANQGILDRAAQAAHGVDWDQLKAEQKEQLIKQQRPVRLANTRIKERRGGLEYTIAKKVAKENPIDLVDPVESLIKDAANIDKSRGERAEAIYNLRRVWRSSSRPQGERKLAEAWLGANSNTIREVGLDAAKYKPTIANSTPSTEDAEIEGGFAGGTSALAEDASTAQEIKLAQAQAQLKTSRGNLTTQLTFLRLDEKDATALTTNTVIDKLFSSPAAQAAVDKINPAVLDALVNHEDSDIIMDGLADETRQTMSKTQLKTDIKDITTEEIEALATIAKETKMSPADVWLAKQLSVGAKRGNVTIGSLIERIKPALDAARAADAQVKELSSKVETAVGEEIDQRYEQMVDLLIQDKIKAKPELTVEAAREIVHTESNNIYDQLTTQLGSIADVTDDVTIQKTLDYTTTQHLDQFFQDSGQLGIGMTGTNLKDARLSQVLKRVRLIRDHTKTPEIKQ